MFYKSRPITRLINQQQNKTNKKTFHHNQDQNQSLKTHKYIYDIAFTVTIIILFGQQMSNIKYQWIIAASNSTTYNTRI